MIKRSDCLALAEKLGPRQPPVQAEAFLGPGCPECEGQSRLRAGFRRLLVDYANGLELLRNEPGAVASPDALGAMERNFHSLSSSLQLFLS
jgi:hypothetical protein